MGPEVITVDNLSKRYRLGDVTSETFFTDVRRVLSGWGKDESKANNSSDKYLFALKDINFRVFQEETFGVIGKNGAGKSTLLKILSRVTAPTSGKVKMKGKIASLLEVGTGFHPDLTGRENIFLNGTILGMTMRDVRRKIDEIIEFSGVENYIDTPVKRYSSGMYVRLAFSVAAHLNADILLMDEVLAVGDAEFQKKCHGKMGEVIHEGRTILFVSHNLGAISSLCKRSLLLDKGKLVMIGNTESVIDAYLSSGKVDITSYSSNDKLENAFISNVKVLNNSGDECNYFKFDENPLIELTISINKIVPGMVIGFGLENKYKHRIFTNEYPLNKFASSGGEITLQIKVPSQILAPGRYGILLAVHIPNQQLIDIVEDVLYINIKDDDIMTYRYENADYGNIIIPCTFNLK